MKRTRRVQAEGIITELLDRYSTPEDLRRADRTDIEELVRPLGLWRNRTEELLRVAERLSEDGEPETKESVLEWYGVGEYVGNSYAISVLDDLSVDPNDEELRRFLGG